MWGRSRCGGEEQGGVKGRVTHQKGCFLSSLGQEQMAQHVLPSRKLGNFEHRLQKVNKLRI